MKRQNNGKAWEQVNELMKGRGIDTATLEIVAFGRGPFREVIIADRIVGSYNCKSCRLTLTEDMVEQEQH